MDNPETKLKLRPNEEAFDVKPMGIKYICEHCHDGEMVVDRSQSIMMEAVLTSPPMIKHVCTKCGGTLMLPRTYPYIEWIPVENGCGKEVNADENGSNEVHMAVEEHASERESGSDS